MPKKYSDFQQAWRIGRILQHMNIRMWTNEDDKGNWVPYPKGTERQIRYSPEAIQHMERLQKTLIERWRKQNPHSILNRRE